MSDCLSHTTRWFPDQLTDQPPTNQPTKQFEHFEKDEKEIW